MLSNGRIDVVARRDDKSDNDFLMCLRSRRDCRWLDGLAETRCFFVAERTRSNVNETSVIELRTR